MQPTYIAWDWDANDIHADEDDGKPWVPAMPQTLRDGGNRPNVKNGFPIRLNRKEVEVEQR